MTPAESPHPASEPRLVDDEREWVLVDGENILGRDEGVAIRIDSAGVSRHHARVMLRSGRATIEDLGSKNGTFCGETRVTAPRALADGDVIRLGRRVRFVFRQLEARATETNLTTSPPVPGAVFRGRLQTRRRIVDAGLRGTNGPSRGRQGPSRSRAPPRATRHGGSLSRARRPSCRGRGSGPGARRPGTPRSPATRARTPARNRRCRRRARSRARRAREGRARIGSSTRCRVRSGSAANHAASAAPRSARAPRSRGASAAPSAESRRPIRGSAGISRTPCAPEPSASIHPRPRIEWLT